MSAIPPAKVKPVRKAGNDSRVVMPTRKRGRAKGEDMSNAGTFVVRGREEITKKMHTPEGIEIPYKTKVNVNWGKQWGGEWEGRMLGWKMLGEAPSYYIVWSDGTDSFIRYELLSW